MFGNWVLLVARVIFGETCGFQAIFLTRMKRVVNSYMNAYCESQLIIFKNSRLKAKTIPELQRITEEYTYIFSVFPSCMMESTPSWCHINNYLIRSTTCHARFYHNKDIKN
jgi:hypothetical protein